MLSELSDGDIQRSLGLFMYNKKMSILFADWWRCLLGAVRVQCECSASETIILNQTIKCLGFSFETNRSRADLKIIQCGYTHLILCASQEISVKRK